MPRGLGHQSHPRPIHSLSLSLSSACVIVCREEILPLLSPIQQKPCDTRGATAAASQPANSCMRARALTSSATAHAAFYFSLALARSTHIIYSYIYIIYILILSPRLSLGVSPRLSLLRERLDTLRACVSLSLFILASFIYIFSSYPSSSCARYFTYQRTLLRRRVCMHV